MLKSAKKFLAVPPLYLIPETREEMKFFLQASVKNKKLLDLPEAHLLAYLEKRKEQNVAFWHMWRILCVKVRIVCVCVLVFMCGFAGLPVFFCWFAGVLLLVCLLGVCVSGGLFVFLFRCLVFLLLI